MTLLVGIIWLIAGLVLLISVLRGAPYVPSAKEAIEEMLELANVKPGMKIADLGSGDGRKELRPGTIILSNVFTFPHWLSSQKKKLVYLYKQEV